MAALSLHEGRVRLVAPAKVNLFLGIGPRDAASGYHVAANVMHTLELADTLELWAETAVQPAPAIDLTCIGTPGVVAPAIPPEHNIAYRAIAALAAEFDIAAELPPHVMHVRLTKRVPYQAGLGGGSSDAAAALAGAAQLWGIDPHDPRVERAAAGLGADVPFFLHAPCARFGGYGEVFEAALKPREGAVVLVKPEGGVSTAAAYAKFDELQVHESARVRHRRAGSREARGASPKDPSQNASCSDAPSFALAADVPLFNNLAPAAEALMPELAAVREWLQAQPGTGEVLLCGSGAATFATCESDETAQQVAAAARACGWWAAPTRFA